MNTIVSYEQAVFSVAQSYFNHLFLGEEAMVSGAVALAVIYSVDRQKAERDLRSAFSELLFEQQHSSNLF